MKTRSRSPIPAAPGFTLVEVLVTFVIVAVLVAASIGMAGRARKSGQMVKELGAARNLSAALSLYSSDQSGSLPYGVDGSLPSLDITGAGLGKTALHGAAAHRYPFRLAQYFGYKFEGVTVIDRSLEYTLEKRDAYMLSLLPALGMNAYGVGGYIEEGSREPISGSVRQMAAAVAPEKMIAFASARLSYTGLDEIAPGFHMVSPPKTPGGDWATHYSETDPSSWGHLDLRHGNKAVVAFLDGSAGTLDREQLKDMRHWNNEAARLDDPGFRPVTASTTGGGRNR